MGKKAFIFAGQGAQFVGMGKELYESSVIAKEALDRMDELFDNKLLRLCFEGPLEELSKTENAQPCIYAVSVAEYLARSEKCDMTAGFSLGEYAALVCSGALDYETGFKLVCARGRLMQEAADKNDGAMAAVLGLTEEELDKKLKGDIIPVNFNAPGQIVVAGNKGAIDGLIELLQKEDFKAVKLNVSGAFHSKHMEMASEGLEKYLEGVTYNECKTPLVSNVTAKVEKASELHRLSTLQVKSPVLWQKSIEYMLDNGVTEFDEIGPGRTLTGFNKRILRGRKNG